MAGATAGQAEARPPAPREDQRARRGHRFDREDDLSQRTAQVMDAKLGMAMVIEEPFRLVYTFGDAYDPGNRHGSVVLQLFGDGRALLDNAYGGAFTKSWDGLVE